VGPLTPSWGGGGGRRPAPLVVATADPPSCRTRPLVPGHQPAPARRPARAGQPAPRRGPGRDRGACMASAIGSSRATNRSRTSSAGLTSRSAPTSPSAATRCWSTARSASAGPPGSLITQPQHDHAGTAAGARRRREERGGAARRTGSAAVLAPGDPGGTRLAFPLDRICNAGGPHGPRRPRPAAASPDQLGRGRLRPCTSTSRINKTTV